MVLEETITQYFRFIRSDHLERRGSALPAQIHRIARRTGVVRLGGERARAPICGGEASSANITRKGRPLAAAMRRARLTASRKPFFICVLRRDISLRMIGPRHQLAPFMARQ